jgi:hypothetical protein
MGYLVAVVLAMLLGFLVGLLSFKVKNRWCTECGMVKSCPRCAGWANPLAVQVCSTVRRPSRANEMPTPDGWRKRGADQNRWGGWTVKIPQ